MKWNNVDTPNDFPVEPGWYMVTIALRYEHETKPFFVIDKAYFIGRDQLNGYLDSHWDTVNDWDEGQKSIKILRWAQLPPLEDDGWHDCDVELPDKSEDYVVSIQKPNGDSYSDYLWFVGTENEGIGVIDGLWGLPEMDDDIQDADTLHVTHWMEADK